MRDSHSDSRSDLHSDSSSHSIRVCQHRSCRKYGAAKVLAAFQAQAIDSLKIEAVSCLGQCGNGPTVLVLPEQVLYCRVLPKHVSAIVSRHLVSDLP